ncbi:MAG: LuxR family transcriptional regulator [Desulfurellales bacterium]|nr:MAG: LuxR family transcriptional regulator [Desulfurellales bacterium]
MLSPREIEVLILAIQGYTVRQIAGKTGIKRSTVRTYRERILDKLNAPCMEAVILRAHHLRLIDLDAIPDVFVLSKTD